MALFRGFDGSEPLRPDPIGRLAETEEHRRSARTWTMATGTMACPTCDAPVAPAGRMTPGQAVECPYCGTFGRVRDFLSLGAPTRPARVEIRVVRPARLL